ncbi:MAG TPA: F0F1 ATP synthase subunit delta [Verrucomicrobiae bacterium]|jgi:F-type H+-transporting ATPase subunit delta|nr:F0F1 ATP synthase subunit delta [Verrucomicrobiae bacterium]
MKISKLALREARQLFRACHVNGVLDHGRVRQALARLSEQQPRGYLQILERLHRLVKLDLEQRAVRVESAATLSPDLQSEITAQITAKYGQGMNISFAQNPALIGGLRIQAGSDLYDGSIKTRLEKLEESF